MNSSNIKTDITITAARILSLSALVVLSLLTAQPAVAGKYGVKIVNESGLPVSGAAVCVGLPGNYKQFGAMFTDSEGNAVVEVPNVPFVVTVSKTRFSGIRISEPARGYNLIKQLTLTEGKPGPRCRAGSSLASRQSIVIKNVEVTEGHNMTVLEPFATGAPSHYRVSELQDFSDASWQPYREAIALNSQYVDTGSVFLQLRRFEGSATSWIEARSEVVTVSLPGYR